MAVMGGRTAVKHCNGDDGDEDVDYAPVTELLSHIVQTGRRMMSKCAGHVT